MTTGFDGLVAAVEQGAWDEVRDQARGLSAGLAPTADAVLREVLGRLDGAGAGAEGLIPLLAALGDLVDAHGWEAGAERIDRQRLVLCEVGFAEAELTASGPSEAQRIELAEALMSVASRVDAALEIERGDAHRTAWFARALDVVAPIAGDEGGRQRARVHGAAGDRAEAVGARGEAVRHYREAAGLLRDVGPLRALQVGLGKLWPLLRDAGAGGPALAELIAVGREVVAEDGAELEAVEELADHLFAAWEGAADPEQGLALAEEILALRRRVATAVPSESAATALQSALAGVAMAAGEAGRFGRERALLQEPRGS
jgi:hypothetical protein